MGALAAVKKNEFSEQSSYLSLTGVVRLTGQEGLDQQTDILDSISLSREEKKLLRKFGLAILVFVCLSCMYFEQIS